MSSYILWSGIFHTVLYFGIFIFPISLDVTWGQSPWEGLSLFAIGLAQSRALTDNFWVNFLLSSSWPVSGRGFPFVPFGQLCSVAQRGSSMEFLYLLLDSRLPDSGTWATHLTSLSLILIRKLKCCLCTVERGKWDNTSMLSRKRTVTKQ